MKKLLWLKEIRQKRGLSTYEVASNIGISQSLYSSIENGIKNVSVASAKKIAEFYGFEWTVFFE
ncbi:MAG: helix-turn-helix transcriptional regulator [Clostridia bacterium]|nr:helix-turn-helix transcriptional regulator [Clostridia bacterium]